ncbi:hypothetical protein pah_c022o165 [Parachlamydia acanthamoebae str. Hall's coccus]|nr:hypothetical protein pah_c022o165 [Parachlamydia acanthamoebae str. Hall's coccus]
MTLALLRHLLGSIYHSMIEKFSLKIVQSRVFLTILLINDV